MTASISVLTPCLILSLRRQYYSCHIQLPDSDERLPAIAIHNEYYSLVQVIDSPEQVIGAAVRLSQRGEQVAVRQLPAGRYALWVKEDQAIPTRSPGLVERKSTRQPSPAPSYILTSRDCYRAVEIRVPDLDKLLSAVVCQGRYYSLFKPEVSPEQALDIAAKLAQRGDETVILAVPDTTPQYSVCVLEPDAFPT